MKQMNREGKIRVIVTSGEKNEIRPSLYSWGLHGPCFCTRRETDCLSCSQFLPQPLYPSSKLASWTCVSLNGFLFLAPKEFTTNTAANRTGETRKINEPGMRSEMVSRGEKRVGGTG